MVEAKNQSVEFVDDIELFTSKGVSQVIRQNWQTSGGRGTIGSQGMVN